MSDTEQVRTASLPKAKVTLSMGPTKFGSTSRRDTVGPTLLSGDVV